MTTDGSALQPMEEQITQETIDCYATLSGDHNPLHVDPAVAALSEFGGTIAHGPISLQSGLRSLTGYLGRESLPPGASVAVTYRHPVRPGDRVHFEATVQDRGEDGAERIEGQVLNQVGTPVATLSAVLPGTGGR
jgi:3-hydroxybutyryl-CoA dehydratase